MLTYHEYELEVFNWLLKKHTTDNNFTFSLRKNGTKNARRDYFIGTEVSRYFGTTFWYIPIGSAGKSTDLINLIFTISENHYNYYWQASQTKSPFNKQNEFALSLVRLIKQPLKEVLTANWYESSPKSKTEEYSLGPVSGFDTLEELFTSVDQHLIEIINIVDEGIRQVQKDTPDFIASRFSLEEFEDMQNKLKIRLKRYGEGDEEPANRFKDIVSQLSNLVEANTGILKNFKIANIHQKFAWILDAQQIISNKQVHYEVIQRNNNISIELHFEGAKPENDRFKSELEALPEGLEWFEWDKSNSIRVTESVSVDDKDAPETLEKMLIKLEQSIGDEIRSIIKGQPYKSVGRLENSNTPKNQILYGPPGTGKTYNTINYALDILGVDTTKMTREDIKRRFDELLITDWENIDGQIAFVTFHQSMSYEDFIEGIKPQDPDESNLDHLVYKIEDGIFKKLCIQASFDIAIQSKTVETEKMLDFSTVYDALIDEIDNKLSEQRHFEMKTKNGGSVFVKDISQQGNLIVEHTGGSRSYTVSKRRLAKLSSSIENLEDVSNINEQFREIIGGSNSSAYWAVLNALKRRQKQSIQRPVSKIYSFDEKRNIVAESNKRIFEGRTGKPYILIIDEINRGNVSQIFGELITLIEKDKRLGITNDLETTLPYSKKKFGVPPNLFIIGTMNTADRSVEALDTALRRRFNFVEMQPKPELISPERLLLKFLLDNADFEWDDPVFIEKETKLINFLRLGDDYKENKNELWESITNLDNEQHRLNAIQNKVTFPFRIDVLLKTINDRIEVLLDRDHLIGHSYFMDVEDVDGLKRAFSKQIIPLLQEYFYGDYGKISLVLGEGFCKGDKMDRSKLKFARVQDYDTSVFEDKIIYKFNNIMSDEFDIIAAIDLLHNKKKSDKEEAVEE